MDIKREIDKHLEWIEKMVSLIGRDSISTREIDEITRHDRCALGQWLNSDGVLEFGDFPELDQLRRTHEAFHQYAGDLVKAAETGIEADAVAAETRFIETSEKVIGYLNLLHAKAAQK